jgi:hypothetical protein
MHELFLFVFTTKENLKFLSKSAGQRIKTRHFWFLLSGDAGGGSHMGTGLCQVRKPKTFTVEKHQPFLIHKDGLEIFFC